MEAKEAETIAIEIVNTLDDAKIKALFPGTTLDKKECDE